MKENVVSAKAVYEPTTTEPHASSLIPMSVRELLGIVASGAVIGIVVIGLYLLLNHFVFGAVLCRPQAPTDCIQAPTYAMIVSQIIGIIAGIGVLVRLRVYRPLLVVLATVVALWTLQSLIAPLAWYIALCVGAVLFGISYGLFAWIARIRSFILALVVTVVLVIIVRIAFM
ncbi:MAG: hypothetical protein WBP12_01660 [Candidatus Saccharimonas sp.]